MEQRKARQETRGRCQHNQICVQVRAIGYDTVLDRSLFRFL